jgi:hypothetical protein
MNRRMIRVLTCLGMISVLLLTMASTGFVSNGYQKVYGASDFPTSDLGTKIRESINNLIRDELIPSSGPFSSMKITISDFTSQTGPSVTNIGLTCFPGGCSGSSDMVIPGRGEGTARGGVYLSFHFISPQIEIGRVTFTGFPHQTFPGVILLFSKTTKVPFFGIPGVGFGQALVQLS